LTDKVIIIEKSVNGIKIMEYDTIDDYINNRRLVSLDRDEDGYYRFLYYNSLNIHFRVIKGNEMDLYGLSAHVKYGIAKKE